VFAVHAFESLALDPVRVERNNAGFKRFVAALPGAGEPVVGKLLGPLSLPGGEGIPAMPVLVGIAVTPLQRSSVPVRK
jgi:hypothetical protein